jgi:hypothetical protein
MKLENYFPGIFDKAVRADLWEAQGNQWEPQAQVITSVIDDFHYPQVRECIRQHAEGLVAYFIAPSLGDSLSIELQFRTDEEANVFLKAYNKVRLHKPKTLTEGRAKRLLNHRMHILPDGREFWLFGKWDTSRRIGKVPGRQPSSLENHIVDEDVLRKCRIVPKGEEPWWPD